MILITVILALLIMGCKSYEKDSKISTRQASNPDLPCGKANIGYLRFSKPKHPDSHDCYLPYRQGPCNSGEILVSAHSENTGKCVRNVCEKDGVVHFEFQCYELNTEGPCKSLNGPTYRFGVNPFTFTLGCFSNKLRL